MTAYTLGRLGTGRMGTAMAGRLIKAGYRVAVWNRTAAKTEALAEQGAAVAGRGYRDADFLSLFEVEAASSGLDIRRQ